MKLFNSIKKFFGKLTGTPLPRGVPPRQTSSTDTATNIGNRNGNHYLDARTNIADERPPQDSGSSSLQGKPRPPFYESVATYWATHPDAERPPADLLHPVPASSSSRPGDASTCVPLHDENYYTCDEDEEESLRPSSQPPIHPSAAPSPTQALLGHKEPDVYRDRNVERNTDHQGAEQPSVATNIVVTPPPGLHPPGLAPLLYPSAPMHGSSLYHPGSSDDSTSSIHRRSTMVVSTPLAAGIPSGQSPSIGAADDEDTAEPPEFKPNVSASEPVEMPKSGKTQGQRKGIPRAQSCPTSMPSREVEEEADAAYHLRVHHSEGDQVEFPPWYSPLSPVHWNGNSPWFMEVGHEEFEEELARVHMSMGEGCRNAVSPPAERPRQDPATIYKILTNGAQKVQPDDIAEQQHQDRCNEHDEPPLPHDEWDEQYEETREATPDAAPTSSSVELLQITPASSLSPKSRKRSSPTSSDDSDVERKRSRLVPSRKRPSNSPVRDVEEKRARISCQPVLVPSATPPSIPRRVPAPPVTPPYRPAFCARLEAVRVYTRTRAAQPRSRPPTRSFVPPPTPCPHPAGLVDPKRHAVPVGRARLVNSAHYFHLRLNILRLALLEKTTLDKEHLEIVTAANRLSTTLRRVVQTHNSMDNEKLAKTVETVQLRFIALWEKIQQ